MGVTNGVIYSKGSVNGANTVKSYNSVGNSINSKNSTTIVPELMGAMYPVSEGYAQQKAIVAASGTTILVSGAPGLSIEVDNYSIVAAGAATVKFMSGATDITGTMSFVANGGISVNNDNGPLLKTAIGENLSIVTTNNIGGHLNYRFV